jgi:septum formation protein
MPQQATSANGRALVLASASPQRRAILERLGLSFTVRVPAVTEIDSGDAAELVVQNALRKARAAISPGAGELVLGCDTVVVLDGAAFGKPGDEQAARAMLKRLSGATHEVLSGLALLAGAAEARSGGERAAASLTGLARTAVHFRALDAELIGWYVGTGEWRGRAGGYAIQGAGAALVRAVEGDYENVVGLPVALLLDMCPDLLAQPAGPRERPGV